MKKLSAYLVTAAMVMTASSAFASKARMAGLAESTDEGSSYFADTRNIFKSPVGIMSLGEFVNFEFGSSTIGTTPAAEGGFARNMGDNKLGFWLGRYNPSAKDARNTANGLTGFTNKFLLPENTFEFFYGGKGEMTWAASFWYSNSDKKSTFQKQNDMGFRVGASTKEYGAYLYSGLGSMASHDTDANTSETFKYTGTMGLKAGVSYNVDSNLKVAFTYASSAFNVTRSSLTTKSYDYDKNQINLKAMAKDPFEGGAFVYSAAYDMVTHNFKHNTTASATAATKSEVTTLPFHMGMEVDATSWLVLRSGLTQNVLLGSTKTSTDPATTDTIANNTTVGAGASLKFGKLMFDGSLAGSTTGNVNGNELLSNASMTYTF